MTESITHDDVVPRLLEKIPEFEPDNEDVSNNLVYLVFGDFVRFAKHELEKRPGSELTQRMFAYLEELARSRDSRVIDVLCDALHDLTIPDPDKASAVMGRPTRKLFRKIVKGVYG